MSFLKNSTLGMKKLMSFFQVRGMKCKNKLKLKLIEKNLLSKLTLFNVILYILNIKNTNKISNVKIIHI